MANFDLYAPTLMRWEARIPKHPEGLTAAELFEYAKKGGWVKDPVDKGGATMVGVTIGTFRTYFGRSRTEKDLRNITYPQWRLIMKRYWDKCKGDDIENQSIAEIFVDWHINCGVTAIRKFQSFFGLRVDGIVGPQTLGCLNSPNREVIFNRIQTARESHYRRIVINDPRQSKFLAGWLNRNNYFTFKP